MITPRIYLDTSVIGGCFDNEFQCWSNTLFQDICNGLFKAVTSNIVAAEIADAPNNVQMRYRELINRGVEVLSETKESEFILNEYKNREILTQKFTDDMNHIALATAASVDVVVSWNFRHIVNYNKINLFNNANISLGYNPLTIFSPKEVSNYAKII
ncbi:MAG: type II toxin-antitoxin system VapC family toxin [Fibrobacter sp.]|nr:type II toxin-antitoxin system VapC family toxin [Fibrobacter sp.]